MIVMKFGGTSVGDAKQIRVVEQLVRAALPRKPVVVVSAHRGVTDKLIRLAREAVQRPVEIDELRRLHVAIMDDLGVNHSVIEENLNELSVLLKGITMVKELTLRTLDYVSSFGERFSSRIIAASFNKQGLKSSPFDAYDVGLLTDDNFGNASPLPEADEAIRSSLMECDGVPIITGFIGMTKDGNITTLGRGGSDFSATIVGGAIEADEVEIWTDVDGVMSADPRVVPGAVLLETISFEEASELAYYGAKVLHPATILPAMKKRIPVRVLNTFNPKAKGTVVLSSAPRSDRVVKSIVSKGGQYIVNISSERMLMGHGYLARIFDVFADHRVVVNMVATSEVSVSVTTDSPERLDLAVHDLSSFATVTVEKELAAVCVIGDGLKDTPGIAGDIFSAMKEHGVNVRMISQGASKINIAFMVAER
ncbi:MAG: hypothetical protein A2Z34_02860, partial [Planctomycetes bacterium RBG_16_59_8]